MSVVGITTKNNPEQAELVRTILDNQHSIIFVTGNAGTGKTFISLAAALELLLAKKYGKIYFGRNPVQVGEEMGFLSGDIKEKYGPFMSPLYDNLEQIEKIGKQINAKEALNKIECIPIAFLRGRNFENSIVIIDEAQNLDLVSLKTILTRMGKYTKLIICGSMNQIDNRKQNKKNCDFQKVIDKLNGLEIVTTIELKQSMRSEWCALVDELLNDIE